MGSEACDDCLVPVTGTQCRPGTGYNCGLVPVSGVDLVVSHPVSVWPRPVTCTTTGSCVRVTV